MLTALIVCSARAVIPHLPGLEVSGIIVELGSAVTDRKVGDRVCALDDLAMAG